MHDFSFEGLDVYKLSISFLARASMLAESLPPGHRGLADQLRRAALSVPLNIAEGSGRTSVRDARRHRTIARGSAMESAAILDAIRVLGVGDEEEIAAWRRELARVVGMLTKLCR